MKNSRDRPELARVDSSAPPTAFLFFAMCPKPKARPSRFLSRPLDRYRLTAAQRDHLQRHRFIPQVEKRPRATNMHRAVCPPDTIELNFLGTSAGQSHLDAGLRKSTDGPIRLQGDRRRIAILRLWRSEWMATCQSLCHSRKTDRGTDNFFYYS